MKPTLRLIKQGDSAVELQHDNRTLFCYVYRSAAPADESPRPYAHPVRTLAGAELTNFRPNDHRWHHGLSFTITSVDGVNFWGGGSYRKADGYQWRGDHGEQRHLGWTECSAEKLAHTVEWRDGKGLRLLEEKRTLTPRVESAERWSLRWRASLKNVSGRTLSLGNYHSRDGLAGSHYTGLQFRGARDLLDDHGDASIGIAAAGGRNGESEVHGQAAEWMEWAGQKDVTQQRVTIRFRNATGPIHWFVRRGNPLAALAFQHDRNLELADGAALEIDHTLEFSDT